MTRYLPFLLIALAACGEIPEGAPTVTVPPGPHMTTVHPAFAACGGPAQKLSQNADGSATYACAGR